jgi:hypothetical protein
MNLCSQIQIYENQQNSLLNVVFQQGNNINGKQSWNSVNGLSIFWYTGTTNQWVLSGYPNTFIFSYTTEDIPLFGWQILGSQPPRQIKDVTITTGDCNPNTVVDVNVDVTNATCGCDGSIVINPLGGQRPFSYFVNGVKQITNFVQKLCKGRYVISTEDVSGNTAFKDVVVGGDEITNYFITSNFNKETKTFDINVNPSLKNNTQIIFDLVYTNIFDYTPSFSSVTQNVNERIFKNGEELGQYNIINQNTQTQILKRPCDGTKYIQTTIKQWKNLRIGSGDTINGFIFSDLIPNIDISTSCFVYNQNLNINLSNVRVLNCNCCNVTKIINNK